MSSLFTVAGWSWRVSRSRGRGSRRWMWLSAGSGLGYTARAALENPAVRRVAVVDALGEVIEWHEACGAA